MEQRTNSNLVPCPSKSGEFWIIIILWLSWREFPSFWSLGPQPEPKASFLFCTQMHALGIYTGAFAAVIYSCSHWAWGHKFYLEPRSSWDLHRWNISSSWSGSTSYSTKVFSFLWEDRSQYRIFGESYTSIVRWEAGWKVVQAIICVSPESCSHLFSSQSLYFLIDRHTAFSW